MTCTVNIPALLVVLGIWIVDAYLLALLARGILKGLPNKGGGQFRLWLKQLTEPLFCGVRDRLRRCVAKPIKPWALWAGIAIVGLIVRHFLLVLLIALQG